MVLFSDGFARIILTGSVGVTSLGDTADNLRVGSRL